MGTSGGGSTISQQLAKNLFHTRSLEFGEDDPIYMGLLMKVSGLKTAIAKIKEWILAIKLERRYTKQEILAMYLNEVSFGNNAYGIQVACRTYFQATFQRTSGTRTEKRRQYSARRRARIGSKYL